MSCEHGWHGAGDCPRCPAPEFRAVLNSRSEMRRLATVAPDKLIQEIELLRARIESFQLNINERDTEIERLRAENAQLATDALAALSKYTATAVEGYRVAPHMLASDIVRLGEDRDSWRRVAETLEREKLGLRDALEFYAERGTWCAQMYRRWGSIPQDDLDDIDGDLVGGKRARAALAGGGGGGG